MSRRLDFLVIGAQKCGTSALDAYLRQHPLLEMPAARKELHFFDNDKHFNGCKADYDSYHNNFQSWSHRHYRGEVTPVYLYWRPAALRIREYSRDIKLIILLRNPIDRAHSHWAMEFERGNEHLPFAQAIRLEADRCQQALPSQHRIYSYVDRGFYSGQILRFKALFPHENIQIVFTEDLLSSPQAVLANIMQHIGAPPYPGPVIPVLRNQRRIVTTMEHRDRSYLAKLYETEFERLEQLLGRSLKTWLQVPK